MILQATLTQATLTQPNKVEVGGSLFATKQSRRVGWEKSGFCRQWRRPPSLQVVVGSSRNPGHPRAPIWKGRLLSNESLRVVQELKRARARGDDARLSFVLKTMVTRLLQFDMLAALTELRRQNECELVLKVFDIVRKEFWYKPDETLFSELVITFARKKQMEGVDKLYSLADTDGLQPSVGFYTEVVNAHVGSGNLRKALDVYDDMRKAGFAPCDPAYGVLRKALANNGDFESVAALDKEYKQFNHETVGETEHKEKVANVEHVVHS